MSRHSNSIDGFIPRRPDQNGELQPLGDPTLPKPAKEKHHPGLQRTTPSSKEAHSGLSRSELDESLRSISDEEAQPTADVSGGKKKTTSRRRKLLKRVLIGLAVLLFIAGVWLGVRALIAAGTVFKGNVFGLLQSQPLKEDKNGRSNILIFGTSEDDPGHEGANLTDSIMVLSLHQKKKNAVMVSIPRDLWVDYGRACNAGYQGKINEIYNCASNDGKDEPAGAKALKGKVGEILGLDIQYYTHLNYGVIKESVDAVGGVDVKIESKDPRGILDRNFDWKCPNNVPQSCHNVKYSNGTHHLDGLHALYLARARGDDPQGRTYGLGGGNFDREGYQQKIIIALKDKASSSGTLTDVGKVSSLIDAFGKNLRTNFETSEIRTLMTIGQKTPNDQIKRLSLVEEGKELVTTGNYGGASIVRPVAGLMDYTAIQAFIARNVSNNPVVREGAVVNIMNGSEVAGAAQVKADELKAKEFVIGQITNAPPGQYAPVELYMTSKGKTGTKAKLEEVLGVSAKTSGAPATANGADFIVIVGRASATSR